jgi:hypothetical protein
MLCFTCRVPAVVLEGEALNDGAVGLRGEEGGLAAGVADDDVLAGQGADEHVGDDEDALLVDAAVDIDDVAVLRLGQRLRDAAEDAAVLGGLVRDHDLRSLVAVTDVQSRLGLIEGGGVWIRGAPDWTARARGAQWASNLSVCVFMK